MVNLKFMPGELKYEMDALCVSTEIIRSGRFWEPPLDGLLLEACLPSFPPRVGLLTRAEKKTAMKL